VRSREAILLAVLAVLAVPPGGALADGADRPPKVQVESDRLRIDHRARTAAFSGNVRARYGELDLSCDSMDVAYGEDGAVVSLRANGGVTVRRGEATATARTARLDARLGLLVLEGGPVLTQGQHRLEGARITVALATGEVDVERARGIFQMGPGS